MDTASDPNVSAYEPANYFGQRMPCLEEIIDTLSTVRTTMELRILTTMSTSKGFLTGVGSHMSLQ